MLLLTGLAFSTLISAQEAPKEIITTVDAVTVFTNGAQITRKKNIALPKGVSELKFTNLSPLIAPESVTVKAVSGVTILSVSTKPNSLDKKEALPEVEALEKEIKTVEKQIDDEETYLETVKNNLELLQKNKDLNGKNAPVQQTNQQQVAEYYNKQLAELKFEQNSRIEKKKQLTKHYNKLLSQKQALLNKNNTEKGEILVKVTAEAAKSYPIEIQYIVDNARWTPSYDLGAIDITLPINIVYKANVQQNTKKEERNNVILTLSSVNPNISDETPKQQTYFLTYGSINPNLMQKAKNLKKPQKLIQGIILDEKGNPLPGVAVVVKGTTIRTMTDFDGKFSLNASSAKNKVLEILYMGYKMTYVLGQKTMTIILEEDLEALEERLMVGYSS